MIRLMVVDDSNIIRSRIQRAYEGKNEFEIVGDAKNGIDAIAKVQKCKPQIMTMDLTMPGMDGISCIKKVMEYDDSIKILVVSALSDITTGLEAIEHGARGFLCKPFTDEELLKALDKVLKTA